MWSAYSGGLWSIDDDHVVDDDDVVQTRGFVRVNRAIMYSRSGCINKSRANLERLLHINTITLRCLWCGLLVVAYHVSIITRLFIGYNETSVEQGHIFSNNLCVPP